MKNVQLYLREAPHSLLLENVVRIDEDLYASGIVSFCSAPWDPSSKAHAASDIEVAAFHKAQVIGWQWIEADTRGDNTTDTPVTEPEILRNHIILGDRRSGKTTRCLDFVKDIIVEDEHAPGERDLEVVIAVPSKTNYQAIWRQLREWVDREGHYVGEIGRSGIVVSKRFGTMASTTGVCVRLEAFPNLRGDDIDLAVVDGMGFTDGSYAKVVPSLQARLANRKGRLVIAFDPHLERSTSVEVLEEPGAYQRWREKNKRSGKVWVSPSWDRPSS